jgi:hypothetical protein
VPAFPGVRCLSSQGQDACVPRGKITALQWRDNMLLLILVVKNVNITALKIHGMGVVLCLYREADDGKDSSVCVNLACLRIRRRVLIRGPDGDRDGVCESHLR